MRNKIIIGCLLLGALSAKAQDTRLSAVEYKERVLEYSRQIKQSSDLSKTILIMTYCFSAILQRRWT